MHPKTTTLEPAPDPTDRGATAADRAFARFCGSGDPSDLARVFDDTAPRLLLVAMHLARDAADAEDLLQTTFVEAIRSAASFERGRPVLPWLLTILARRAKNHRRSRTRNRAERLFPESVSSPDPGPGDRVAEREVIDRVAAAFEEVDSPFREVLVLRLVHGLRPVEIARALGRPAGTVHAQMHRGLRRLRALLPRGLALPAALVLGAGKGLAAVRAQVLRAVPGTATMTAATVAGGLAVKHLLGIGAAVTGLALLLVWGWPDEPPSPPGIDPAQGNQALVAGRDPAGTGEATSHAELHRKGHADRTLVAEPDPAADRSCLVSGRVVAGESGVPLASASVRLWGYATSGAETLPPQWSDPEPLQTGPDGRFALPFVPVPEVGISMEIAVPGRVPVTGGWIDLRPGARLSQGDVPLMPGTPTALHAVDEEGRPADNVPVDVKVPWEALAKLYSGALRPRRYGGLRYTDENGELPPVLLFPRTWELEAGTYTGEGGYRFLGPHRFTVEAGEHEKTVTLRVARPAPATTIAGRAVDEGGIPLAGLEIRAETRPRAYRTTRTAADGSFFFPEFMGRVDAFPLSLESSMRNLELLQPTAPVPVGTTDVEVVVRRRSRVTVHLTVIDAKTRSPVEEYRHALVACTHREDGTYPRSSLAMSPYERRPGGTVEFVDWPGSYVLFAQARDTRHALVLMHRVDLPPATAPIEVVVSMPRRVHWSVRVVDEAGEPVAGTRVELLEHIGTGDIGPHVYTAERAFEGNVGGSRLTLATAVAESNDEGLARLSSGPEFGTAALRLTGEPHVPLQVPLAAPPGTSPLEVVVQRATIVQGRIVPEDFATAWGPSDAQRAQYADSENAEERLDRYRPRIVAVAGDDRDSEDRSGVVDDDGRFRITSLAPGTWKLQISVRLEGWRSASRRETPVALIPDLRPGEVRSVEIDATHLAPGHVRGRVFVNGEPWSEGGLYLRGDRGYMSSRPQADGSFTTGKTLPGVYEAHLSWEGEDGQDHLLLGPMEVHVESGATTRQDLHFTRRRLTLRILDAEGRSAADRHVSLQVTGGHYLNSHYAMLRPEETDADGRVTFDPVPAGQLDVVVWDLRPRDLEGARNSLQGKGGSEAVGFARVGPVSVPAGREATQVELRLR